MDSVYDIIRLEQGRYLFRQQPAQSVQIFFLDNPDSKDSKWLAETDLAEFELKLSACEARPFFLIQSANGEQIVAERTLPVAGMNNFRDMGGYVAHQGKRVKWASYTAPIICII